MSGIFGVVAFILVLFFVGAILEEQFKKAALYGASLAFCCLIILFTASPQKFGAWQDCYTEWDGRITRTICD